MFSKWLKVFMLLCEMGISRCVTGLQFLSTQVRYRQTEERSPTLVTSFPCRHVELHVVTSLWTCISEGRLLSYGRCLRCFVSCKYSTIYPPSASQRPSRWSRQYRQNRTTTSRGLLRIWLLSPCVTDNATVSAGSTDTSNLQHTSLVSPRYYILVKRTRIITRSCDTQCQ